eukprot:TRINITY_DN2316_c0_g1_i4.p1 TRINITY_DN2316_c0_g1~~TRINITY_DN2316_c0_g1_i4.p1  ORF type:complete len:196 (-),score=25.69 TRINITY_DN2316_c0_g1_i4:431-1018(-)
MVCACFRCMKLLLVASFIAEVRSAGVSAAAVPIAAAQGVTLPAQCAAVAGGTAGYTGGLVALSQSGLGDEIFLTQTASKRKIFAVAAGVLIGMVVLGADASAPAVTWDCWKPILHDESVAPSRGRLLADVLNDPLVSESYVDAQSVFLRNRWNESWRIDPVVLPWGQIAAHASRIASLSFNSSAARSGAADTWTH